MVGCPALVFVFLSVFVFVLVFVFYDMPYHQQLLFNQSSKIGLYKKTDFFISVKTKQ